MVGAQDDKVDTSAMLATLRNGVVAVAAPGVAAEDATNGEIQTFEWAVLTECFQSILGTGRGEAA